MAAPLHISQISRRSGVTKLVVAGHGLTAGNVGNAISIVGALDGSANVTGTISRVIVPDGIELLQPGLPDLPLATAGGAIGVGGSVALFVKQCIRRSGVTKLTVSGHGLTAGNIGNKIQILGVLDPSVNVTSTISRVIDGDGIEFLQPGLPDIPTGLSGGAISVG